MWLVIADWVHAQDGNTADKRDNTPKYSNEFLQLGVGARYFGMANTAVSQVDDVTAGYWNPAGLLQTSATHHELILMHASYFGGLANYDYGAFSTSIDEDSRLALSVIRFAVDDIPDTRFLFDANGALNYDNIRFFTAADYAFIGSYARKLPVWGGLNAGGNFKVVHRIVGDFAYAWGFGLDVGVQKTLGKWQLGIMGRDLLGTFNAWSHNSDELATVYGLTNNDLPANTIEITLPRLIFGASRSFQLHENVSLSAAMDLDMTFDGKRNTLVRADWMSMDPKLGTELAYKSLFFLRMGIGQFQQTEDFDESLSWTSQPTAGLGVQIQKIRIDYALTDAFNQAEGLYSHVFSLNVQFDAKE